MAGKENQNRKWTVKFLLLAVIIITLLFTVGTIAFFTDDGSAQNFLFVKQLDVNLVDIFDKIQYTLPGDTINKDVYMENLGEIEAVIRMRLEPSWNPATDALGNSLDINAVTINYGASMEDWTLIGGWYYYNKILSPGEQTSLLVDSIKLEAVSNDIHDVDYSNASYVLDVFGGSLQAIVESTQDNWGVTYTIDVDGSLIWSE